jgi:HK97 family phage prohead protease
MRVDAMERKFFRFDGPVGDGSDEGRFSGKAAVYGNVDQQNDVIERGAFKKSLAEQPRVKVLYQHEPSQVIGLATLTDGPDALIAEGRLELELPDGKAAWIRLKKGLLDGISIGYETVKRRYEKGVRHLQELKVFEISLVTFPANELARVSSIKEASLNARLRSVEDELRKRNPNQTSVWAEEVFDDHAIVYAGDKWYWVPVSFDDDGRATIGSPGYEVRRAYVPVQPEFVSLDVKAGRAISAANKERLKSAMDKADEAIAVLRDLMRAGEKPGAEEEDAEEKRIVRRDGKYCVATEDGSKILGCHDTRGEALAQLRAVEAGKADERKERIAKAKAEDPGFFRHCVAEIAPEAGVDDPEAFCAFLHERVIGTWPAEKEEKRKLDELREGLKRLNG